MFTGGHFATVTCLLARIRGSCSARVQNALMLNRRLSSLVFNISSRPAVMFSLAVVISLKVVRAVNIRMQLTPLAVLKRNE